MITSEKSRQESVRRYGLADAAPSSTPDPELTGLVVRTQRLMGTEHAAITILDGPRAVLLATSASLKPGAMPRAHSVCDRVVAAFPGRTSFMSDDLQSSPLVADHPQVNGELGALTFYAGVTLVGIEGRPLGVLCAWSTASVPVPPREIQVLESVSRAVVAVLDARRRISEVPRATDAVSGSADPAPAGPSVHDVIDAGAVRTLFQPVVELSTRSVVGYQAFSRGPEDTDLETPAALLEAARSEGRLAELDWLCRVHAMQAAAASGLPSGLSWFVNVETAGVLEPCPEHLLPALVHARRDLRVVLEVVGGDLNGHVTHLLHAADQARRDLWGVAVDHVGVQDASSALLPMLAPDVIKLDMSLLQQRPDRRAAAVTATVRAYAERTGAVVVAEGIETEEHERLARAFGATYGQGHLYGRPGGLPDDLPEPRAVVPLRQQPAPADGATPFEVVSRHRTPERATKDVLLHISKHLEDRCRTLGEPFVLLVELEHARFLSARLRDRFRELSCRSALTVVVADMTRPEASATLQVSGLLPGCRPRREWVVTVLSAGYSAAFVARDCGDGGPDAERRLDFVYTHDPVVVAAVGRSFLSQLVPPEQLHRLPDLEPGAPPEAPGRSGAARLMERYARRR